MWQYDPSLNRFGTTEALMLLPYWSDGCIGSMEGLLFESSATTPYHFFNQAELSVSPSDPMVGLAYSALERPARDRSTSSCSACGTSWLRARRSRRAAWPTRLAPGGQTRARGGPPRHGSVDATTWEIYRGAATPRS